jgi:hypothetical protein
MTIKKYLKMRLRKKREIKKTNREMEKKKGLELKRKKKKGSFTFHMKSEPL